MAKKITMATLFGRNAKKITARQRAARQKNIEVARRKKLSQSGQSFVRRRITKGNVRNYYDRQRTAYRSMRKKGWSISKQVKIQRKLDAALKRTRK